ncbi:uncharacterized protein LOC128209194 [Mya arenaria]|uniref:uncharacterized protein LOC128209194 n=1 Tax=Mya arenaria TaxID=6604 RepID=UPI0022E1F407|nr:uncharacterized protein LOC128209194 [Mya arenaria]
MSRLHKKHLCRKIFGLKMARTFAILAVIVLVLWYFFWQSTHGGETDVNFSLENNAPTKDNVFDDNRSVSDSSDSNTVHNEVTTKDFVLLENSQSTKDETTYNVDSRYSRNSQASDITSKNIVNEPIHPTKEAQTDTDLTVVFGKTEVNTQCRAVVDINLNEDFSPEGHEQLKGTVSAANKEEATKESGIVKVNNEHDGSVQTDDQPNGKETLLSDNGKEETVLHFIWVEDTPSKVQSPKCSSEDTFVKGKDSCQSDTSSIFHKIEMYAGKRTIIYAYIELLFIFLTNFVYICKLVMAIVCMGLLNFLGLVEIVCDGLSKDAELLHPFLDHFAEICLNAWDTVISYTIIVLSDIIFVCLGVSAMVFALIETKILNYRIPKNPHVIVAAFGEWGRNNKSHLVGLTIASFPYLFVLYFVSGFVRGVIAAILGMIVTVLTWLLCCFGPLVLARKYSEDVYIGLVSICDRLYSLMRRSSFKLRNGFEHIVKPKAIVERLRQLLSDIDTKLLLIYDQCFKSLERFIRTLLEKLSSRYFLNDQVHGRKPHERKSKKQIFW